MNSTILTIRDITHSAKHLNGQIFEINAQKIRDLKKIKSDAKYDVTWIPILFRKCDEQGNVISKVNPRLKFDGIITGSKPNKPKGGNDEENSLKTMLLILRRFSVTEIERGPYAPKTKSNTAEQEIENEKIRKRNLEFKKNLDMLCDAFDAIVTGYNFVCDEIIKNYSIAATSPFRLYKIADWMRDKKIPRKCFRQVERTNEKESILEPLSTPIYRVKLPVNDGKMQSCFNDPVKKEKKYSPYIYDLTKCKKSSFSNKLVPAMVETQDEEKETSKKEELTPDNIDKFLTYMSLIGGEIKFGTVVISSQGFSLSVEVCKLHVKPNQHKYASDEIDSETLDIYDLDEDDENMKLNSSVLNTPISALLEKKITPLTGPSQTVASYPSGTQKNIPVQQYNEEDDEEEDDEEEEEEILN